MSRSWQKDLSKKVGSNPVAPDNNEIPDFEDMQKQMQGQTTEPEPAPVEPDPAPAPEPKPAAPKPKPQKPKQKETPKAPPKKQRKQDDDEDEDEGENVNKEKFSIYLPEDLAMSLRLSYVITKKKYSHTAEQALTDMLLNRYQCDECTAIFSMSETDESPSYCPSCGGSKKLRSLRIDRR